MSTADVMRSIRATEQEAEKLRREALVKARETVKEAEVSFFAEERENTQKIRASAAEYHRERDSEVEREIVGIAKEHAAQREQMRKKASGRIEAASSMIVERILSNGNH